MIEEVAKELEFINRTRNRLYQFAMSVVVLKCQSTINELSRELASQVQFKIIPDNSTIFCVNADRNCLIDQNGRKITGDRTRQVFVSREGTCVFPNKLNNSLQYPDGESVDFDSLVGQKFYPMTIEVNVPYKLCLATAAHQRISDYINETVFAAKRYPASQDRPEPEHGLVSALTPS